MTDMNEDFREQLDAVSSTAAHMAAAGKGKTMQEILRGFGGEGLLGAIAGEQAGGLALPIDFAGAIVAASAAELIADPVPEALLCAKFGASFSVDVAAAIAQGSLVATFSLHETLNAREVPGGFVISGALRNVVWGGQAEYLLAPVRVSERCRLALLDLSGTGIARREAATLDLERSRSHLVFSEFFVVSERISPAPELFDGFRKTALILYSQFLAAQARACLGQTVEYLASRRQFGRALSSFQAIRFALARCALELENLRRLIAAANAAYDGAELSQAEMAYALAAEICPGIVEKSLHLNGGMGFTWEVPIHRYLKRTRAVTDDLTAASARERVAEILLRGADGARLEAAL